MYLRINWKFYLLQTTCPESENGLWPKTPKDSCTTSNPICINRLKEVVRRCCLIDGEWKNSSTCSNYQVTMDKINPCPEGFHNTGTFCYSVIENTTFPPNCPISHNLQFEEYINIIDKRFFPIWMPVKRERSSGVGKSTIFSIFNIPIFIE